MYVVYRLTITATGQYYIGSTGKFKQRLNRHRNELNANKHHCGPFQEAYNKYGEFEHEVLLIVDDEITVRQVELDLINENLNDDNMLNVSMGTNGGDNLTRNPKRADIIKRMTNAVKMRFFNMSESERIAKYGRPGKKNGMYGKTHTESARAKMSEANIGRPSPLKGVPMSKEHHRKFMEYVNNRNYEGERNPFYGKQHSEETKKRLSDKLKGRKGNNVKPVVAGGVLYPSMGSAAKAHGIDQSMVLWKCKNPSPKYKDWYKVTKSPTTIESDVGL